MKQLKQQGKYNYNKPKHKKEYSRTVNKSHPKNSPQYRDKLQKSGGGGIRL